VAQVRTYPHPSVCSHVVPCLDKAHPGVTLVSLLGRCILMLQPQH
jgi:hypothetical protein